LNVSEPAITVEGLGKRYRLGATQTAGANVGRWLRRRWSGNPGEPSSGRAEFWALRDVDFSVNRGEVLGIIGRNGAGKSTLLKILTRITEPTTGSAVLHGRVGSLLEVGTGFHPELSGRDNIFLNGAILGMRRAEISRQFDDIVEFAEIGKFIDTPVKRYSSGMYVRLAFAVAAHLQPEILLVDEVLAVGDVAFQQKCMGKMSDTARQGRTILFVSHNMTAIRNLCHRVVWLEEGRVREVGGADSMTQSYLQYCMPEERLEQIEQAIASLPEDENFELLGIRALQGGQGSNVLFADQPIEVEIRYRVKQRVSGLRVFFDLMDDDYTVLIRSFHDEDAGAIPVMQPGEYVSVGTIPPNLLAGRSYHLRIHAGVYGGQRCIGDGIGMRLNVRSLAGKNRAYVNDTVHGKINPAITWSTTGASHRNCAA
jgi:lipopolysaccharide transport system ATP-binding protein